MADVRWIGGAAAVAQVDDFTPSDPAQNDVLTLTVTGENGDTNAVTFTVGATHTVAAAIAGIVAAWNASTHYLCTPITASDNASTTVKLTADSAGVPFYVASTISAGTFTRAATTANSGPYDFNTALNWSGGVVPGYAADEVIYIEGATILYGLDQTASKPSGSAPSEGADMVIVNNTQVSSNPSTGRSPAQLRFDTQYLFDINQYSGPGSPTWSSPMYLKVATTTSDPVINIYGSGTNSDTTLPPIDLVVTHSGSTVNIYGGSVGLSYMTGDAATAIANLNVFGSANVYMGNGACATNIYWNSTGSLIGYNTDIIATMIIVNSGSVILNAAGTTTVINGGSCSFYCAFTTLYMNGGSCYQYGDGTITALTQTGGTLYSRASGTVTAATILGGICDATAEIARTWTAVKLDPPGVFKFNSATQTLSAHVEPNTATKIVTYSAS